MLIANFNNEQYSSECISSLKKQTYQNIEKIIHDDLSSDNSEKMKKHIKISFL